NVLTHESAAGNGPHSISQSHPPAAITLVTFSVTRRALRSATICPQRLAWVTTSFAGPPVRSTPYPFWLLMASATMSPLPCGAQCAQPRMYESVESSIVLTPNAVLMGPTLEAPT